MSAPESFENAPVDNGPLDIVARLRAKANWPLTGWDLSLLLSDAADEIEALRSTLHDLTYNMPQGRTEAPRW